MAIEPSQEQTPARPLPTRRPIDEYSPLLPKISCPNVGVRQVNEDEVSPVGTDKYHLSNLIWIMVSVWIGTFTAGLGECSQTAHVLVASIIMDV